MSKELDAAARVLMDAANKFTDLLQNEQEKTNEISYELIMALGCAESETVTVVSGGEPDSLMKLSIFLRAHFSGDIDETEVSTLQ